MKPKPTERTAEEVTELRAPLQRLQQTAGLVGPELYREAVTRDRADGLEYHALPTDDPLRALNILCEAAGPQPLSEERDDQGG